MDFKHASQTVVVSDIHLADAEKPNPKKPLWKKFKRAEFFIDYEFKALLEYLTHQTSESIELILNGDIFDFDSVMELPTQTPFHINWLERLRGLDAEEEKSRFKLNTILKWHVVWIQALRAFILKGNRVVFVIGNHDLELHWSGVQEDLIAALDLPDKKAVRFVEWFYLSNQDTLIEHGNQYDSYCMCSNPINPAIKKHKTYQIRLPFGNLAGKYMTNGMGLLNPHNGSSFIKSSIWEYFDFYFRFVIRTQPFLFLTWFWSAIATLVVSLWEGFRPSLSDPLTISDRIDDIAHKANGTTRMVLALRELHAVPAFFRPIRILQELWLDRALLFGLVFFISFEIFMFFNLFTRVSIWLFALMVALLFPAFVFYARSVDSEAQKCVEEIKLKVPVAATLTGVKRVIVGHTHIHEHRQVQGVEYLNTGTWSPAYHDVECTQPYGKKYFAWVKTENQTRKAALYEWKDNQALRVNT